MNLCKCHISKCNAQLITVHYSFINIFFRQRLPVAVLHTPTFNGEITVIIEGRFVQVYLQGISSLHISCNYLQTQEHIQAKTARPYDAPKWVCLSYHTRGKSKTRLHIDRTLQFRFLHTEAWPLFMLQRKGQRQSMRQFRTSGGEYCIDFCAVLMGLAGKKCCGGELADLHCPRAPGRHRRHCAFDAMPSGIGTWGPRDLSVECWDCHMGYLSYGCV